MERIAVEKRQPPSSDDDGMIYVTPITFKSQM